MNITAHDLTLTTHTRITGTYGPVTLVPLPDGRYMLRFEPDDAQQQSNDADDLGGVQHDVTAVGAYDHTRL